MLSGLTSGKAAQSCLLTGSDIVPRGCFCDLQGVESDEAYLKAEIEDRQIEMDQIKEVADHTMGMAQALTDCVNAAPECLNRPLEPGLEEVSHAYETVLILHLVTHTSPSSPPFPQSRLLQSTLLPLPSTSCPSSMLL